MAAGALNHPGLAPASACADTEFIKRNMSVTPARHMTQMQNSFKELFAALQSHSNAA